jgi:response regulator RpfG family c-di-GMP phosphodiesterase
VESARLYEELRDSHMETLVRLARTAEYRDMKDTASHLQAVGRYSKILARSLGLPDAEVENIENASPLHDIGKVGIRDAVLLKPGPLTPAEVTEMQKHTSMGWEMLSGAKSPLLRLAAEIALGHHERFDGQGYPGKLKGDTIPLAAQIVAVADVLDALTSERAYKPAWSFEESERYIMAEEGRHFHPKVVAAFRNAADQMRAAWKERGGHAEVPR